MAGRVGACRGRAPATLATPARHVHVQSMRDFNTAGPIRPARNHHVPPLERLDLRGLLELVRRERYFVLHAPRRHASGGKLGREGVPGGAGAPGGEDHGLGGLNRRRSACCRRPGESHGSDSRRDRWRTPFVRFYRDRTVFWNPGGANVPAGELPGPEGDGGPQPVDSGRVPRHRPCQAGGYGNPGRFQGLGASRPRPSRDPHRQRLTARQRAIVEVCEVPRGPAELMEHAGVSHRSHFRRKH